jgi:hypothetical protein
MAETATDSKAVQSSIEQVAHIHASNKPYPTNGPGVCGRRSIRHPDGA